MLQEKGPVESIFREIEKIEQLSFDFGEESQVAILLHPTLDLILYLIPYLCYSLATCKKVT